MIHIHLVLLILVVIMAQQQRSLQLFISFNESSRETIRVKVDASQLKTVEDLKLMLQTTQEIGYTSFKIELIDPSSGAFSTAESSSPLNISSPHLFVHVTNLDGDKSNGSQLCIKGRAFDTMHGLPILQRTITDNISTDNKYIWEENTTSIPHTLRIREEEHADLGTGLITWDGAIVLAKYLEMHQERLVHHQRILEVGAGTGLAGISAALLGAHEVVLTDLSYALDNLRCNVDAALGQRLGQQSIVTGSSSSSTTTTTTSYATGTASSSLVSVACLDWADAATYRFPTTPSQMQPPPTPLLQSQSPPQRPTNDETHPSLPLPLPPRHQQLLHDNPQDHDHNNQWDMIIGADVVWLEDLIPLLVQTLVALSGPQTMLLLSHQKRSERSDTLLFNMLNQHFIMELVPRNEYHPVYQVDNIRLYRGRKKRLE